MSQQNSQNQSQTKDADAWWYEDGPIPGLNAPEEPPQPMVVRGAVQQAALSHRSEYAELAELAQSVGPRDPKQMLQDAKRVGALLGARAYYDFPAGGGRVTGPSIDLMDALAVVWGRLLQSVSIVSETNERVHLRGRVLDLFAVTAVERDYISAIAPAPGGFAKKPDQADRWRVMQLQSASSKAVRGALEHALPAWLVDAALEAARSAASQKATGGRPLPEARAKAVESLGRYGLSRTDLEAHVGQPLDLWAVDELDMLRTLARDLAEGRVAVEQFRAGLALKSATAKPSPSTGDDRLASLGLGKPAAAPSQSSPTPPPPSPDPAPSRQESASQSGASGGGQTQAAPPKPEDPERRAALDRLTALRKSNEDVVARIARQHGLTAPGRSTTAKVLEVIRDVEGELRSAGAQDPAPAGPPITEETQTAIGEWCLSLEEQGKGDAVSAAFNAAGLDAEQGPETEEQGLALLAELKKAGS